MPCCCFQLPPPHSDSSLNCCSICFLSSSYFQPPPHQVFFFLFFRVVLRPPGLTASPPRSSSGRYVSLLHQCWLVGGLILHSSLLGLCSGPQSTKRVAKETAAASALRGHSCSWGDAMYRPMDGCSSKPKRELRRTEATAAASGPGATHAAGKGMCCFWRSGDVGPR